MSKLRVLLAAALAIPFLTLATIASGRQTLYDAFSGAAMQTPGPDRVIESAGGYECCVVYFAGRWYCIPC